MKLLYYTVGLIMFVSCVEIKSPDNAKPSANREQNAGSNATNYATNSPTSSILNDQGNKNNGSTGQLAPPTQVAVGSQESNPKQSTDLITEIFRVLDLMSADKIEMTQDGEKFPGTAASKKLKSKYLSQKLSISAWEDFIRDVATQSSPTGKPYTVSSAKKKDMLLSDYLEELLKKK
jgi:Family of unknown function (DUF5329)